MALACSPDRYFLTKTTLGQGKFGVVVIGKDRESGGKVAIKRISKKNLQEENVPFRQVEDEVKLQHLLSPHSHIVNVLGCWADAEFFNIVLTVCADGDLGDVIRYGKQLANEDILEKMHQAFSAIRHVHSKDIIHCDIKPDNFMVDGSVVRLTDFGFSQRLSAEGKMTDTVGTPAFWSPEQALLETSPHSTGYAFANDVWAAGVTAHMLATFVHPISATSRSDFMQAIREGAVSDARGALKHRSPVVVELVEKCLTKDSDQRPSAQEICFWFDAKQDSEEVMETDTEASPLVDENPPMKVKGWKKWTHREDMLLKTLVDENPARKVKVGNRAAADWDTVKKKFNERSGKQQTMQALQSRWTKVVKPIDNYKKKVVTLKRKNMALETELEQIRKQRKVAPVPPVPYVGGMSLPTLEEFLEEEVTRIPSVEEFLGEPTPLLP